MNHPLNVIQSHIKKEQPLKVFQSHI